MPPWRDSKNSRCLCTSAHSATLSPHCTATKKVRKCDRSSVPPTKGGPFPYAPNVRGPPNSATLAQVRCRSSVTFQSTFLKGFISLYSWVKSACFFCFAFYAAGAKFRIILTWLLCSPLARIPYVAAETANFTWSQRRQLAGIYVLCACRKKSLMSPQNTLQ